MKLIIAILLLCSNNFLLNAKETTIDYSIKGMMCKMNCPDYVKEAAIKVDGVNKCDVDFNNGFATITFDDTKIDENKLVDILVENTDNMYEIKIKKQKSKESWWDWLFGS